MPPRLHEGATRICNTCGETRPIEAFRFNQRTRDDGTCGRLPQCSKCQNVASGLRYYDDPGKRKVQRNAWAKANRKRRLEVGRIWLNNHRFHSALHSSRRTAKKRGHEPCSASVAEIEQAFAGRCHVCGLPEEEHATKLCLDHDHESGAFRGFLCNQCNAALGFARDSADRLLELAEYLMVNQEKREEAQRME